MADTKHDYNSWNIIEYLVWRHGKENGGKIKCYYCDREFTPNMDGYGHMAKDHVQSQKEGGDDGAGNLVLCCRQCNSVKGSRSFHNDPDGLEKFKRLRRSATSYDDKWVKDVLFKYATLPEYPDHEKLRQELYLLMKDQSDIFTNVEKYRNHGVLWGDPDRLFYFFTFKFQLQPNWLWVKFFEKKEPLPENILLELEKRGYSSSNYLCKYLEPFCEADKVIDAIIKEVNCFNSWYSNTNIDGK